MKLELYNLEYLLFINILFLQAEIFNGFTSLKKR